MAATISTRVQLTAEDKAVLREFWRFYEPLAAEINADVRRSLEKLPEWAPLVRSVSPAENAQREQRNVALQRAALLDGDWAPYLQDLHTQGATYARIGVSWLAWYDVMAIYRESVRRRIAVLGQTEVARMIAIGEGMTRFLDVAMAHLGEAYLSTKESIIAEQQEAIRELSTPVLQVSARVLIVPIVGRIDGTRARQLAETVLAAIRDRRARGIVLDVTGMPQVDTEIAGHIVTCCEAARLMGACTVITGISSENAQALVALGAKLPVAQTHVDLQEGLVAIERTLAGGGE